MKKVKDWLKKLKQQEKQEEAAPMPISMNTGSTSGSAGSTLTSSAGGTPSWTPATAATTGYATSGYITSMPAYGTTYTTTTGTSTYTIPYTVSPTFTVPGYGYSSIGMGSMFTMASPPDILTISNGGKEIVRLNKDGTVTWANNEIKIDEAMEAFAQTLGMSAEMAAGVTNSVKLRMRDSVFEDLISIAKEKGPLSAEELTYLLSASKIVEKLRGAKE
jgi:hypothetical protein